MEKKESIKTQVKKTDNSIKAMEEMNKLKDEMINLKDDELKRIVLDDTEAIKLLQTEEYPVLKDLESYYENGYDASEFPVDLELMFIAGYEPDYTQRLAGYLLDKRGEES